VEGMTGGGGGGGSDRVGTQSSARTKFTIGLDRLSEPLPYSSSNESSHAKSLIHRVTAISPPTMVVTSAPNQHPGINSLGFPPSSGAFTLDLAKAIECMEQDSTLWASRQPSPKDGVPPPISCAPSAQGSGSSMLSAQDGLSSIGGITIVPQKNFNQPPVSAS
jgi:hypothetical protein